MIDYVFRQLSNIFGSKYYTMFNCIDEEDPEEVLEAVCLVKSQWFNTDIINLDRKTIDAALRTLRQTYEWPPSIAEFIKICSDPKTLGLPSADEAYRLATHEPLYKLHPVIRGAAENTGVFELRHMQERHSKPIFKVNYENALKKYMNGEDVCKPIPKALPEPPEPTITPREVYEAKQEFQRLRAALRASTCCD